ncbi:hypothetical protein SAMN05421772_11649 [Paracoccus saliphilus]|uniref:Uncharacterized protein n=1 Tax=Paracoccus saliphilus TaxID=405559 RepID=A0AA45W7A1_9RHOB|nr:hypothetical protein SAMN05421772_11649 [Paracoccus saliphilus]
MSFEPYRRGSIRKSEGHTPGVTKTVTCYARQSFNLAVFQFLPVGAGLIIHIQIW